MELLDIYDENGIFLGTQDRNIVHRDGMWHKTVHCWLYDKEGNVFFQRRADSGTFYTTSSGHLSAGESVNDAFSREIKEEIGIALDASDAKNVEVVKFSMDKVKIDGSIFKDRAFANIYVDLYEGDYQDFKFDKNEVTGILIVNAKDALNLFQTEELEIKGKIITNDKTENKIEERMISREEFLVNKGETLFGKYGEVLKKIISLTDNNLTKF